MARVEWTRHPDDVEPVVGMLICSQFPNAVRMQPSQGDGGVDIFVPGQSGFAKERAVYQVKSYCKERLTSSQKAKIKRSFYEVIKTAKDEGWKITEWHLVMPMNPTDNELNWLKDLTAEAEFPCETNGLLFCDTLAAHYPKVIDYYLHDGKDRLQAAMNNLTAVIRGRQIREDDAPLGPTDVVSDLASIYEAINACDPFYHYDFAVSDRPPADQPDPDKPGLVAVSAVQQDAVWITIEIFATSLAALEESPISMRFNVAIPEDDDELRQQFQKFVDYGAPMTMPTGTVSGSLDLPGGLGGDVSGASLQVLSAPDNNDSEPAELVLAILEPDSDTVIASTTIRRIDFSVGQAGVRSVFADVAELFTLEMLVKAGHLEGQMNLGVAYNLAGRRPAEVVDGLRVLAAWQSPNRIAFGLTYGPPDYGAVATVPTDRDGDAKRWARICEALARIQDHVTVLLKMPAEMTKDQAIGIFEVEKLVSGEAVTGSMSGTFKVIHQEPPQFDRQPDKVYEFVAIKAIKFTLGDDVIDIGKQALFLLGRYVQIGDEESEIEPISEGVSFRYTGDLEVTRVAARHPQGIASTSSIIASEPESDADSGPSTDSG
jgi:hypothetical protein